MLQSGPDCSACNNCGKADDGEEETNCFEETEKRKTNRKIIRCCVRNCTNNSNGHEMFSFPGSTVKVKGKLIETNESVARVQKWVEFARNEEVCEMPLASLKSKFFMCSAHFDLEQFKPQKGKRKLLRNSSVPNILNESERQVKDGKDRKIYHMSLNVVLIVFFLTGPFWRQWSSSWS